MTWYSLQNKALLKRLGSPWNITIRLFISPFVSKIFNFLLIRKYYLVLYINLHKEIENSQYENSLTVFIIFWLEGNIINYYEKRFKKQEIRQIWTFKRIYKFLCWNWNHPMTVGKLWNKYKDIMFASIFIPLQFDIKIE